MATLIADKLEAWKAEANVRFYLDDGVKVNYNKFPRALAKVPGLSEWK